MDIRKQLINLVKEYKYVALILAIGILLMLLPEKQEMPDSAPVQSSEGNLQAQLEEILSQIWGVGKVRVLLTVESGEKTLYIRDEDRSESSENSQTRSQAVIITDSDRAQQGLISSATLPFAVSLNTGHRPYCSRSRMSSSSLRRAGHCSGEVTGVPSSMVRISG